MDDSGGKTGDRAHGGAKSGALCDETARIDPGLQAVIDAWPGLPQEVKAEIVSAVGAAGA